MKYKTYLYEPIIGKDEKKFVNDCLNSNWISSKGDYIAKFEKKFSQYIKIKHSLTVSNGTAALHLALLALDLKKSDEVLVTPRSYVSTASCLQNTKAKIKFVDIDLNTQNVSTSEIKKNLSKNTRLIICTHLAGWPCDMKTIKKIIGKRKIFIIEDCSQAHGAKINNRYVGSFGDISVWSFCNDKIISTIGEGGMISCNNRYLYKKLWAYKDCGKNLDKVFKSKKDYLFKWVHDFDGTNLRMTEVQAAVGIEQLKKLKKMLNIRSQNVSLISKGIIKNKKIISPKIPKNIFHAGYRCYLTAKNKIIRDNFINYLNKKGFDANQGSCPEIYKEKRFSNKRKYKELKNAKKLGDISISLPSHHLIQKKQIKKLINTINNFIIK